MEALINDPRFYARTYDEVGPTLERLQALGQEIERAYARWAELERNPRED